MGVVNKKKNMAKLLLIFYTANIIHINGYRIRKDSNVDFLKSISETFGLEKVDQLIKTYDDKEEENLLEEAVKEEKEEWKNHRQNIGFANTTFTKEDLKDWEDLRAKIRDRVEQKKEETPKGDKTKEVDWANKKWSVEDIDVDIVEDMASWAKNTNQNTKGGKLENFKKQINKFSKEAEKKKTKNGKTDWRSSFSNLLKKGKEFATESWEKYNGCKWMKKQIKENSPQKLKGKKMKKIVKNMKMWCVQSKYCSMIVPKETIEFKCGENYFKIATESGVLKKKQFLLNFDSCDGEAAELIDGKTLEKIWFYKKSCNFLN